MKKFNPNPDRTPEEILTFIRNNPNVKHDNLYLCESVDMDGNVIDTKIGVNMMTNYCLTDHFINGNKRITTSNGVYLWLGSGQSPIDPSVSQLESYISNLGTKTGVTAYSDEYPYEYDDTNKIFGYSMRVLQQYWDYTAGNNGEYSIWELGLGNTQTTLLTHAHIYDEHGQQTCIVKKPNTRLYITTYITAWVSVVDIQRMYEEGKYLLISAYPVLPVYGSFTMYWPMITRKQCYRYSDQRRWDYDGNTFKTYTTNSKAAAVTGDPQEVIYDKGVSASWFWEDNYYYMGGFRIESNSVTMESMWNSSSLPGNASVICFVRYQMDTPEELETTWVFPNNSCMRLLNNQTVYTGNECDDVEFRRFDKTFGYDLSTGRRKQSDRTKWDKPYGALPCLQFDISEMNQYNYISKEWDIPVAYRNAPTRIYDDDNWHRRYKTLKVSLNGTTKDVYIFVNMMKQDANGTPIPRIIAFNNSNMVISATDTYWDSSSYVAIPNLAAVPVELQRKRYYIVTSGTLAELNPVINPEDEDYHEFTRKPIELTDDTTGTIERMPYYVANTGFEAAEVNTTRYYYQKESCTTGSTPLICNDKGYFVIGYKLIFADSSWNVTEYPLTTEDDFPPDKFRRWMTRTGDRIVAFTVRTATKIVNGVPASSTTTGGYGIAANKFSVWTIVDSSAAPTKVDLDLSTMWSDSSLVSNTKCWHKYSWSDLGYLVVAKRRIETEFVWVDIYAANGPEMHLVTNAKHAGAIERTKYVCYQDMNLSMNADYVFQLYNMESQTIEATITISDGSTYTVNGLYGYNDHIYICLTSSANINIVYYYNISTSALVKTEDSWDFMNSSYPYWTCRTFPTEEDLCIVNNAKNNMAESTWVLNGIDYRRMFPTGSTVNSYMTYKQYLPCLNKINGGKQYVYCSSGLIGDGSTTESYGPWWTNSLIVDFGQFVDGDPYEHFEDYPYNYLSPGTVGSSSGTTANTICGPVFPYNDGIVVMCSVPNATLSTKYGRMWWFPPELCLPSQMKGTTRTLNSYNNPILWSCAQKFQFSITNDLSRLFPQNGG